MWPDTLGLVTRDRPGSAAMVAEDARSVPVLAGMQLERHCTTSNTKRVEKLTTLQGDLTIFTSAEARAENPPCLPPGALLPLTRGTPSATPWPA